MNRTLSIQRVLVSRVLLSVAMLLPSFAVPLLPQAGEAASCTRGVDCYCDRVKKSSDPIFDPSLLVCEDFEAPTLYRDTGVGNGAPDYGPWYDDTGYPNARGNNSYWNRKYASGPYSGAWRSAQPTGATLGRSCGYSQCFQGAWSVGNKWQANGGETFQGGVGPGPGGSNIMIMGSPADFSAEVATISPPTNTANGVAGVFDGSYSLAHRVPAGGTSDIQGTAFFPSSRTFGITMAVAYPNNSVSSRIWVDPWKHNEWHNTGGGGGGDGLFLFHNTNSYNQQTPFEHFIFGSGQTLAQCQARLAAATKTAGDFICSGGDFYYRADKSVYNSATDWPLGTWACVQGYFQNLGTSNSSIQIWFTGPAGVQKKIIGISGMDLIGTSASSGYDGLIWNSYSNTNQSGADGPTTATTFRYEDNVHIRAGAPVSCAQIGFSGNPQAPPTAPSGLTVQ